MKKLCFILISFLFMFTLTKAQNVTISGEITDGTTEEVLPGVSISVKGSANIGTVSDLNGKYSLSIPAGSVLVYSFIGYKTQEENVGNRMIINVSLQESRELLDEVIVIGYGTVRKSDLTGSVASVKAEALTSYPTTGIAMAMAGKAPGVFVQQNNGSPGGTISVRIRGTNSISGDNTPLYVVDGFPYNGSPSILHPNDIESMEILKDASATAIYGSRGANGVILITTKKGKTGRTNVQFESSYSIQHVRKEMDMMDAGEYAEFTNRYLINDGGTAYFDNPSALGKGVNWQNLVLRNAPILNNSLTISGGNEKTKFSIGSGYYDHEGIVRNSGYSRFSLRMNIDHDINKYISLFGSTMYSQNHTDSKNYGSSNRGNDLYGAMLLAPPTLEPYNEDGTYNDLKIAYPFISNVLSNPLGHIYDRSDLTKYDKFLGNAAVTIKPFDGFFIKISGGIDLSNRREDRYTTTKIIGSSGNATVTTERYQSILNENTVGYSKKIGVHDISVVAGLTFQNYERVSSEVSGVGFISDVPGTHAIGTAESFGTPSTGFTDWKMFSYLGRIQYSLRNKYLATVSFRMDGSSRYSKGNKWGYFPSAALAWRISEEDFIKDTEFISDLKLRLGYGETGSTAISPYYTLNMLSSGKVAIGSDLSTWYAPGARLPSDLKWETTAQANLGLDIGILNNRYRLTLDYYIKNTYDLLNSVPLPTSLGYTNTVQNVGEIQNKGLEIGLDAYILNGKVDWSLTPHISFNKNTVKKLYGGNNILGSTYNTGILTDYVNILQEGEPLGMFYGYKETGYDENGMITYLDLDDNGNINSEDKMKIGDPNPKFIYALTSSLAYKDFEFNFFIQGSYGNDIFNLYSITSTQDFNYAHNRPRDMINNTWTAENPNTKYPRASKKNSVNMSDRFVEDGSFLRLRNVQLAYNLPLSKWNAGWIKRAQVYVSGQNLLTWTTYSGYDPEINYSGSGNSINLGLDYYAYPMAKSWTFGVKLDF
jgi:TonB-linked SusC/RagA family outer membrane protein